jgi:negative regulator of flagellin synthesis FlgM
MSDVSPISSVSASRAVGGPSAPGRDASSIIEASPIRRQGDQVEVSEVAAYLNKLRQLPPVRQDLVESARAQIAADTYDTPEKLDTALDELLNDI